MQTLKEERLPQKNLVAARRPQAPTPAPQATKAVTVPDNRPYRERYLDDVAPASIVGRMVTFSKEGQFLTSDAGKPIDDKAEFVVLADETLIGWLKFNGEGEPPDRQMGLLYDGWVMPARASLGDTDQSTWEVGLDGQPADPWQHHQYLILQNTETAELFTFVTSSRTGRRAVGNLLRHYDRMRKTHQDELPVVRLGTGGFEHKDSRVCSQAGHQCRCLHSRRTSVLTLMGRREKREARLFPLTGASWGISFVPFRIPG